MARAATTADPWNAIAEPQRRRILSRFELRPGGKWIFVMHGPDGTDYSNQITWREIVPPTMRAVFPTRARLELVREKYHAGEGGKQTLGRLAALVEKAGGSQGA